MSDQTIDDDDFLDGCLSDIDFTDDEDDDETAELRALFPDGDPSKEIEWRALFREEDVDELDRRYSAIIAEEQIRGLGEYSGSGRDLGIAARLRALGLKVVEIDGWKTRGSSTFNPKGSVDHHTASGLGSNAPALGICINGRTDLPGPLCNVLIARDNTCYVIAAGRANHAGTGGYWGITGNSNVYGVEHENTGTGTEPWREDQRHTAALVHAALLKGVGRGGDRVCQHKEWTSRKIDKWDQTGADMRNRVSAVLATSNPTGDDDDMPKLLVLKGDASDQWWITDGVAKRYLSTSQEAAELVYVGVAHWNNGGPFVVRQGLTDAIPTMPSDGWPGHGGVVSHFQYTNNLMLSAVKGEAQRVMDSLGWTLGQIKGQTDVLQENIEKALSGLVTNIVEALPSDSGGGVTPEELQAAVERGVEKSLTDSGLLGLLPGR